MVVRTALLLLQALAGMAVVRAADTDGAYSCDVTSASGLYAYLPTKLEPNSTIMLGYKGNTMPGVVQLSSGLASVQYVVSMDPDLGKLTIRRESPDTDTDADPYPPREVEMPAGLMAATSFRYFWVRVVGTAGGAGEVSFGRAGQEAPLLTFKDSKFAVPRQYRLRPFSNWVHKCTAAPATGFAASLGCRKYTIVDSKEILAPLPLQASPSVPVDEEASPWTNGSKIVRFLVMTSGRAFVRLHGSPQSGGVVYQIGLSKIGALSIQRGTLGGYMANFRSMTCMSSTEFRLFTIRLTADRIELYEGLTVKPLMSVPVVKGFELAQVGFSGTHGTTRFLHACQGYEKKDETPESEPTRPPAPTLPPATQGTAIKEALAKAEHCRVVHTFKYRFDSYYALSEEGLVSNSVSTLSFAVAGRRDVHLQLVPSLPPPADEVYEIDIAFHNYTNLDRGKEQKVATVRGGDLLSENKLTVFTVRHDMVTGVINVTSEDGRLQMAWRDPAPFPLRYFSICSGSSAGNDTVWVFGCGQKRQVKSGCSRPLVTYSYSHSQYFSVEREGVVNGSRRTIYVHLRAAGSGHIRLESVLPPAVDALLEVDLSHDGSTSIDFMGRRMSTVRVPGLLTVSELRGFWLRQDMELRRIDVGKIGSEEPLVFWTAPPTAKFPELRLFSLATSRSVGNGTWYYGCKEGQKPEVGPFVAVAEHSAFDDSGEEDVWTTESEEETPELPGHHVRPTPLSSSASLLAALQRNLSSHLPPQGVEFYVRLNVSKVYLDDSYVGQLVVKGNVLVAWSAESLAWDSTEYDDIEVVTNRNLVGLVAPDFHVPNGDVETGGEMQLHNFGLVQWVAPLSATAYCAGLDASRWPNDQHTCEMRLVLTGRGTAGSTIFLVGDHEHYVQPHAARPLWHLVHSSFNVSAAANASSSDSSPDSGSAVIILVTLRRNTPVMNRILVAPYIVIAALSMLAYWVQEPLPRDKVVLGSGSLVLIIMSFIVFEIACPPGLVGIPLVLEVYCYASCSVALTVVVSAILTAVAKDAVRDGVTRGPPLILCRLLNVPFVKLILLLSSDQVQLRMAEDELDPDGEEYRKGSSQLYARFGADKSTDCGCNDVACSKQAAMEARYYWAILSLATERFLSLICVITLILTEILVR